MCQKRKKVVIYGAKVWGRRLALRLYELGSDFYCFIDRNHEQYKDGLYNKPVYSPEWLLDNGRDFYVVIAASNVFGSFDSITNYLLDNHFPQEQIINRLNKLNHAVFEGTICEQYFEFMEFYRLNTAFLDCGGYDGYTSSAFARYTKNQYSKIVIFEPDARNMILCEQSMKQLQLHDLELIQAGCSDEEGNISFESGLQGMSHCTRGDSTNKTEIVKIVRIDDIVNDLEVGMIKMDIEGMEMEALKGAEKTIKRDRPLLAICVYHKPGDTLEIMEYLHNIVPEYHYRLRHYSEDASETVLYAMT